MQHDLYIYVTHVPARRVHLVMFCALLKHTHTHTDYTTALFVHKHLISINARLLTFYSQYLCVSVCLCLCLSCVAARVTCVSRSPRATQHTYALLCAFLSSHARKRAQSLAAHTTTITFRFRLHTLHDITYCFIFIYTRFNILSPARAFVVKCRAHVIRPVHK